MTADIGIEIVSPLSHTDTDHVCRVARAAIVATCAGCGETVYSRVHLPLIAFGFWCGRCCPCRTFVASPEELEALRANRAAGKGDAGSDAGEVRHSHNAKAVIPGESVEERRARGRQRMADAVRARWADPVKRAALLKSMRSGMQRAG